MRLDPATERKALELAGLAPAEPAATPKTPKYRNKRTQVDGEWFDSKREAARWGELQLMERSGAISDLKRQVHYLIEVNGWAICRYVADFTYLENGRLVVEDTKGVVTKDYKIKRSLMRACHGVEIRET
jgi:hypothetical protein